MHNEEITRGPAVSDSLEWPSDRAELIIILRSADGQGEPVIWRSEDDRAYNNVPWFIAHFRWGSR